MLNCWCRKSEIKHSVQVCGMKSLKQNIQLKWGVRNETDFGVTSVRQAGPSVSSKDENPWQVGVSDSYLPCQTACTFVVLTQWMWSMMGWGVWQRALMLNSMYFCCPDTHTITMIHDRLGCLTANFHVKQHVLLFSDMMNVKDPTQKKTGHLKQEHWNRTKSKVLPSKDSFRQ